MSNCGYGVASYAELPWITDKPQKYEKAIRSIAYCNIGKMPGKTTTSSAHLSKLYQDWKDILFQQIALYDPNVIIICGTDTLQCMNRDLRLDISKPKPEHTVKRGGAVVDIHDWHGRRTAGALSGRRIPPRGLRRRTGWTRWSRRQGKEWNNHVWFAHIFSLPDLTIRQSSCKIVSRCWRHP